jgi:hypothetical protein
MQSRPKILIVLDLDFTHFITSKRNGVHWIGGKEVHLKTYADLITKAEAQGIDVVFAVVTSKTHFDDICEEAAKAFKPLLHRSNPSMITKTGQDEYMLVNKFGVHFYECLTKEETKKPSPNTSLLSHFHIVKDCKVSSLLHIGKAHDIPAERIILLDDTDYKLRDAQQAGMQIVSFECFYQKESRFFDDTKKVKENLDRIHAELFKVFERVMRTCHAPTAAVATDPVVKEPYNSKTRTQAISTQPRTSKNCLARLFSCCLPNEKGPDDESRKLISKNS